MLNGVFDPEELGSEEEQGTPPAAPAELVDVDVTPQIPAIARTKAKRKELADYITDRVEAAQTAKGELPMIWGELDSFQRNDAPTQDVAPSRDLAAIHIPFSQPRIDALCSEVCTVIGTQNPRMLCESGGDDASSSQVEACLNDQWTAGGFDRALKEVTQFAAVTNYGFWRVSFQYDLDTFLPDGSDQLEQEIDGTVRFAGLKIESIDPADFVIAPATLDGIQSASLVGHRFWQRLERIREMQDAGVYFKSDEEIEGGDNPEEDNFSVSMDDSNTDVFEGDDVELVECYEVVMRKRDPDTGRERWYRAIVASTQNFLLSFEKWPYTRPPYFHSGFLTDPKKFWSKKSVGKWLSPLQQMYDRYESVQYNGTLMNALPPIAGPEQSEQKYKEVGPGDYITLAEGENATVLGNNFRGEIVQVSKADLERQGDIVSRSSTNSLGSEEAKVSVTATQTQAIQNGVATGLQDYISTFCLCFAQMAAFSIELLVDNYALWRPLYRRQITIEALRNAFAWDVNGKSPSSSPMARLAELQQIWEIAKDPDTQIDKYEVAKAMLAASTVPGASKFQKEKPLALPGQPTGVINGQPSSGGPLPDSSGRGTSGPPTTPQRTQQGTNLPPIAASLIRPQALAGSDPSSGGGAPDSGDANQ